MADLPAHRSLEIAHSPQQDAAAEALLERLRVATRGEYDVFGELGRGGMATVYLAHEISLGRKVAIKVMAPGMVHGHGMVERFKREARTAAGLSHPSIIPIYAVREVEELLFCVIKLVQGTPLDAIMRELRQLPIPMIQAILGQVGDALAYAHRQGVVHRDIKPGNILIDNEGWAVVTDFGIAKVQESETLTMTGVAVGTPAYMSPEQCGGDEVTGASDQYSLGVVAYEMLAGRPPFTATAMMALLFSHFHEPPPPLGPLRPDCPPEMRDAVMRMLSKKAEDRWPSLEQATVALGARQLAHDDPTRSQLITLARTGVSHRIVSQVQTPRSPIPLTRKRDDAIAPSASRPEQPTVGASRVRPWALGAAAVGLLGVGFLLAQLAMPGVTASSPGAIAAPSPAAAVPPAASVVPSPTESGAPLPGATNPGAPQSGAPQSGAPQSGAPQSGAPTTGARSPANRAAAAVVAPPVAKPIAPTLRAPVAAGAATANAPDKGESGAAAPAPSPPTSAPPPVPAPVVTAPVLAPPTPIPAAPGIVTPEPDVPAEVRAAIQSFASAIAAGDMAAARRLYPGMPPEQREGLDALWKDGGTMTPRWTITNIVFDGTVATARVSGSNLVTARRSQPSQVPVSLRARLERRGAEWRLVALVN